MTDKKFTSIDYWKSLVLYGLNAATYKIALAHVLLDFANKGISSATCEQLSVGFFDKYLNRINSSDPMPQQGVAGRQTVMERIIDA